MRRGSPAAISSILIARERPATANLPNIERRPFCCGVLDLDITFFFRTSQLLFNYHSFLASKAGFLPYYRGYRKSPFTTQLRTATCKCQIRTYGRSGMAESRGVAILVGAGDAIGAAVARRFAKGGYTVCICRRDAAKSKGLVDELTAAGHRIHAFSVDARQEAEVQKLFSDVESNIGPIEVCLFNAGSNVNKPLVDTTEKLFFKAWELACYAGFLVGREAARVMLARGGR